jgi:hypothetical protein
MTTKAYAPRIIETGLTAVVKARVTKSLDGTGFTVWADVVTPVVDRPTTYGITVRSAALAGRIAACIDDQKAFGPAAELRADINGQTYISHSAKILGRTANADLRRLGY